LGNFFWRVFLFWCVGQLIGFGFFISKKQKQCAVCVVGTKSVIHFTEKITEVLAGEQQNTKRLSGVLLWGFGRVF